MRRVLLVLALLLGAAGTAQAQNRFWVVNNTGETIQEIYVSSSRVQNWGPDILGASVLPAGQRVWVTPNFGDCVLDVRVVYAGGRAENRMGVNACSLSVIAFGTGAGAMISPGPGAGAQVSPVRPAPVQGGNPSFNFVNLTGETIREIYVSLSTQSNWGPDRLGANVLPHGASLPINLPMGAGCLSDIRVVYMNGRAAERRGLETCSVSNLNWR
jgi:hypothetical protein